MKKIISKKGVFALKEVQFSEEQRKQFLYAVQSLHGNGYRHVIPIYSTTNGSYLLRDNQSEYYLMPWLETYQSNTDNSYKDLLRAAAKLHSLTETKGEVNQTFFQYFYEKSKTNIDRRRLDYERFIEKCERKQYMSPFELLYCTHFMQIIRMEDSTLRQLEDWFDIVKEKKQDRVVICHGNLAPKHLLYDENGHSFLINFERTFAASPIYDLLYFFRKLLNHYPQKASAASNQYIQYIRNNPLTEDEKLLLFYYMTETSKIHKIIHQYETASSLSERNMVTKLQRAVWQMQAASNFISKIDEAIKQEYNNLGEAEAETDGTGSAAQT